MIQTFNNEYSVDAAWRNVLESPVQQLEDHLSHILPNDSDWELWIPANLSGLTSMNVSTFINKINAFVLNGAPTLGDAFPENVISECIKIERRSFRVRFCRYPLGFCSNRSIKRFHVERMLRIDESHERYTAVHRSFIRKAPKLLRQKAQGSFTILALEWASPLATPANPIHYAARLLNNTFQHAIDRVIVVSTNDDLWSLQYYDPGGDINLDILKHKWWIYNPLKANIWQRLWK